MARGGARTEVGLGQGRARKVCVVCRGGCVEAGDWTRVRAGLRASEDQEAGARLWAPGSPVGGAGGAQ